MKLRLNLNLVACIVAASYLTLGIAAVEQAEKWWWAYGAITFILALSNLIMERNTDG